MAETIPLAWEKGNEFLLTCGSVHEPYQFCSTILEEFKTLVPYDQGLFLMLDVNKKIARSRFVGLSSHWSSMYLDYYSHSQAHGFGLAEDVFEPEGHGLVELIDWHEFDWIKNDFMDNYIRPRQLSQSLTLIFFDLKGTPATAFSFDRLENQTFSEQEIELARLACTHLSNLYKNMFVRPQGQVRLWDKKIGADNLTDREKEVLDLMCQGMKPVYISRELRISQGTTNKHIAHIYKKLGVNNKQELLVKILGK